LTVKDIWRVLKNSPAQSLTRRALPLESGLFVVANPAKDLQVVQVMRTPIGNPHNVVGLKILP